MDLLYIDFEYNYGQKSRGPHLIAHNGFKASFEKMGFKVGTFYFDDYLQRKAELQTDLLALVEKNRPRYIFFQMFEDQFEFSTLDKLKEMATTINWFGDDTWRFKKFSSRYAPHFSFIVTTDKFSVARYHEVGVKNVILSQWAAMESVVATPAGYKNDVAFIGQADPYRRWFIAQLRDAGIDVKCFGFGWGGGHLTGDEMGRLFVDTKINLNIANSVCYDFRFLKTTLKGTLQAIRGKKNKSQIKARNFEINYGGGFQLTDWVPGLSDYYEIGKEIDCFSNATEAIDLIKFYLENDELRERIRVAGQRRAQAEHTYYHRLEKVFSALKRQALNP
jgi:spore maturation protein CgeB